MKTLLVLFALSLSACPNPADCSQQECLRAYVCAASCGAATTNNGCCPCPSGTIDTITCPHDGGTDGGP